MDRVEPAVAEREGADACLLELARTVCEVAQQAGLGDEVHGEDRQARMLFRGLGALGVGARGAEVGGGGGHGFSFVWTRASGSPTSASFQRSSTWA